MDQLALPTCDTALPIPPLPLSKLDILGSTACSFLPMSLTSSAALFYCS